MCYKKTYYVDVNAFLPQNLMILKANISKTSTGRYIFLFIFICGNSKCTRIQKIKKFSGEVNWVLLALICCEHSSAFILDWIIFILPGYMENYKISHEFDFTRMSSNFSKIQPRTAELAARQRLKNTRRPVMWEMLWLL